MRSSVVRTGRSDNSGGDRILSINITLLLTPVSVSRFTKENTDKGITGESGMVVLGAIAINTSNFFVKLVAWAYSGSHSMFSEAIHSLADTINQVILAYGIHKSTSTPTKSHPYGYSNVQ